MAESEKSRRGRAAAKAPTRSSTPARKTRKPTMTEPESTSPESTSNVFEIDRIRRLVELMKEHDLSEVDLRESRQRIRICRGPQFAAMAPPAMNFAASHSSPVAPQSGPSAGPAKAAPAVEIANTTVIKSPMVGTFYSRANPKAEPFVKVGDSVDTNSVVCIIEAMKVFNEIPAEVRGKIVAVLVEDGEAVEFDKPLFRVETK
jgi:acetyl-CoA carboxylase biotin carboxyl carrier protein